MDKEVEKIHVRIENHGIQTRVFINDEEVKGVKRVNFAHTAGWNRGLPKLEIELAADEVTLVTTRIPELPELYRTYYVPIAELVNSGIVTEKELNTLQNAWG